MKKVIILSLFFIAFSLYVGKKKSSNSSITSVQSYNAKGWGGRRESSFSLLIEMSWGKDLKILKNLLKVLNFILH